MEINRNNIFDIVNKCDLKPDKDYGQNFLVEPTICERIVNALELQKDDEVLEIGPGLGSLTHFLAMSEAIITIDDIDERMIAFLNIHYSTKTNVKLVREDIRNLCVSNFNKIVGNLPYNITTETIIYLLKNAVKCQKMVLMCQSETYAHVSDVSGKDYGPLSVLVHLLGSVKKLFTVKAGCFYPVPKCDSTVFEIDISKDADFIRSFKIFTFVKQMFLNRRKTISNNLKNAYKGLNIEEVLCKANIPLNKRPEEISPSLFVSLYDIVCQYQ